MEIEETRSDILAKKIETNNQINESTLTQAILLLLLGVLSSMAGYFFILVACVGAAGGFTIYALIRGFKSRQFNKELKRRGFYTIGWNGDVPPRKKERIIS